MSSINSSYSRIINPQTNVYESTENNSWEDQLKQLIEKLRTTGKFKEIRDDFKRLFTDAEKVKMMSSSIEKEGLIHNLDANLMNLKLNCSPRANRNKWALAADLTQTLLEHERKGQLDIPHLIDILSSLTTPVITPNPILQIYPLYGIPTGATPQEKIQNLICELQYHRRYNYVYKRLTKVINEPQQQSTFIKICEEKELVSPEKLIFIKCDLKKGEIRRSLCAIEELLYKNVQKGEITIENIIDVLRKTAEQLTFDDTSTV